jgi:hypothetical protein
MQIGMPIYIPYIPRPAYTPWARSYKTYVNAQQRWLG